MKASGENNVDDFKRLERADEQVWNLFDEAHQAAKGALEPCPAASQSVGLLDVFPDLFLPDQRHEGANQIFRGLGNFFARDGILAKHSGQQSPSGSAFRQRRQRFEDRFFDERYDSVKQTFGKANELVNGAGEDLFGTVPCIARMREVRGSKGMKEVGNGLSYGRSDHAQRFDLVGNPVTDLVEDAVVVERLRDQAAKGNEFNDGAQYVAGAAVHLGPIDRVYAQHDGEHAEAGNDVGFIRDIVANTAESPALRARRGTLLDLEALTTHNGGRSLMRFMLIGIAATDGIALDDRGALLLDDVGGFMGHQAKIFIALTGAKNNVAAVSKRPRRHASGGALRIRV